MIHIHSNPMLFLHEINDPILLDLYNKTVMEFIFERLSIYEDRHSMQIYNNNKIIILIKLKFAELRQHVCNISTRNVKFHKVKCLLVKDNDCKQIL